jgi:hypothetical protein
MPVRLFAAVAAARVYPEARRFLIRQGWNADDVEALPVVQVALMHAVAEYDRLMDEMYKWQSLPYWEAAPGMEEAVRQLKSARVREIEHGGVPLATLLMPAVEKVVLARARLDRRLAALRVVEAIRLHAATKQGKLPAALTDIKEVPIPVDPITGKSFEYTLAGTKARLYGPPLRGLPATEAYALRYELEIVTPKKRTASTP